MVETSARFRPSSADRWLLCPGSTKLVELHGSDSVSTFAQREGTAAHRLAELCLHSQHPHVLTPASFIGKPISTSDFATHGPWIVDEEMAISVQEFLDEVEIRMVPGCELFIEYALTLQPFDPDNLFFNELRGTGDVVILNRPAKTIHILDLKYGKGVLVPGDSRQLKVYGALCVIDFPFNWQEVETCIVQPRARDAEGETVKSVMHSADAIVEFVGEICQAMYGADEPNAPLNPGEKQCRWCSAKADCPALRASGMGVKHPALSMTASSLKLPDPGPQKLPDPTSMTPAELAAVLERRPLWDLWIGAVEERAARLLEFGQHVPGWKLVAKTKHRQWALGDSDETAASLRALGLKTTDIYTEPKLKSPAQVEKLLKKPEKTKIESLIVKPLGEPTMVRDSDSRPATRMFDALPNPNTMPLPKMPGT